ncbi:dinitrogenase iron-molybdenum cofactor [Thermococci archaeon]|nr:MAG: dinitrogenase iron-molybdenum cofactor [Thermococci archaeon]
MNERQCLRVPFEMKNDTTLVDSHYGDSKFFVIYEISDLLPTLKGEAFKRKKITLIEKRYNKAKGFKEDDNRHGDLRKFKAVISQLLDIDILAPFRMEPNFLRIRDKTNKVPFFTKTRELNLSLHRLVENFDELWNQVQRKKKKNNTIPER